jgi:hypothetical protein
VAKRKFHFEQVSVETVKAIVAKLAAKPSAANIAHKPAVAVESKKKRA